MTREFCGHCGREKEAFDLIDRETGKTVGEEIVCPDNWRASHW